MRQSAPALCFVILATLTLAGDAWAVPDIGGAWVAPEDSDDIVEDAFDGKLFKERFPTPQGGKDTPGGDSARGMRQSAYWETLRERKESRSMKNLHRLGAAYPLVTASRFDITPAGNGYVVVYNNDLPRDVKPNPEGRIFTASGDELVVDTLGYSLSWWDKDTLVIESDTPRGGKVVEKFRVTDNPRRLHHSVSVKMRILKETVVIERVFEPAAP